MKTRVNGRELAEDIVQETFALAWKKYGILEHHPNPIGWLKCTARYKIFEWKRRREGCMSLEALAESGEEPGKEDAAYSQREWDLLFEKTFSGKERELFHRHFFRGIPAKDLAKEEHMTEGNMRVKLYRMKIKIKKVVKDRRRL